MFDAACQSDTAGFQRSVGTLRIGLKQRDGTTALADLRQDGCLKARFPRVNPGEWLTGVTLNTSGGVAGGDRLHTEVVAAESTRTTISAQAAERFYRSVPGGRPSQVQNSVTVARSAALEWLPQETILFDRCALRRRLDVDVAQDAWFLGVESLIFGRAAMGERVETAWLRDVIRVRRDGRLLLHDAIRFDGQVDTVMQGAATGGGGRAIATVILVAPEAGDWLHAVRHAMTEADRTSEEGTAGSPQPLAEAAASAWNGLLLGRILAPDSAALRRIVTHVLAVLRGSRPLPRVWTC